MASSPVAERCDVLIGGAGFAGLTLAIALRQGLGSSFGVTVADPNLGRPPNDVRASTIAAVARRLFETLGVWSKVEAQPILDMVLTDSRLTDAVRPTFLSFDGEVERPGRAAGHADPPGREPIAYMIENGPLLTALVEKAKHAGVALRPAAVASFPSIAHPERAEEDSQRRPSQRIDVALGDGGAISARLLVAADGAHSAIRERAGIASNGWSYDQCAIVTTVTHERDHHGRAEEHFLPAGPFAILPLTSDAALGHRSSIVWTEETREAARIVALPDDKFHAELERRFGLRLGAIAAIGPRHVHPLGLAVARAFIADRLALVGDAAHVIHPIAGQGLNLGLKDAAALAEVVVDAVRLGLDPGSLAVLERYQRWRRFDTLTMGVATDGLNRMFSNQSDVLRLARDVGLGLVDRLPALKRLFVREAAGLVGEVPKLLRGEAL